MPSYRRYKNYDDIAWVYNRYWGGRFLQTSLAALENLVLAHLPENATVLDVCCGTGQLAQSLLKRGFKVTGIDGSREMLKYARHNAPGGTFILDDARTFTLSSAFHLAVSMFDSLNHVLSLRELTDVFANVRSALLDGGFFLFDLITEKGYQTNWNGYTGIVADDHVCLTLDSYNQEEHLARFEATIFRLKKAWQRSDVLLPERCYSEEEIRSALETSGFDDIVSYECDGKSGFKEMTEEAERAFFLCFKH